MHEAAALPPVPATESWAGALASPIAPATWRSFSAIAISLPWSLACFVAVTATVCLTAGLSLLVLGLPLLAGALLLSSALARAERARLRAQLGSEVAAPSYRRAAPGAPWPQRIRAIVTDRRRWSEVLYAAAALGLMILGVLVLAGLGAAIAAIAFPAYSHLGEVDWPAWAAPVFVVSGLALLFWLPFAAQYLARWQVVAARALLGPDPDRHARELAGRRIEVLARTRSGVLSAADAERRRIERDLHDGAQQRLVALGVELGMARRDTHDPDAVAAIGHAHEEVKAALAELRDLVRGIHPAILTDRGLDAALSALAARCPLPVRLELPGPDALDSLPGPVQAAAYFVTAEALANAAKHSGASQVWVSAERFAGPPALWLEIADDGTGEAREEAGGGLAGLRGRVEALDGALTLTCAPGEGTRLEAVIPLGGAKGQR